MGKMVVNSAQIQCTMGAAPGALTVTGPKVKGGGQFAANVMDNKPNTNVAPFGMCNSMGNPAVQAATNAAMGTLTPQTCTPMTSSAPWTPGKPKVKVRKQAALDDACTLTCTYGGTISVKSAGQTKVTLK